VVGKFICRVYHVMGLWSVLAVWSTVEFVLIITNFGVNCIGVICFVKCLRSIDKLLVYRRVILYW